jgi:hypothetical protein
MNKKLLFTMPLVALLASCGSIGGNSVPDEKEKTRVDLPAGGESISPDSEEKADDYQRAIESFFGGVLATVDNDVIEIDTTFNVAVDKIEFGQDATGKVEANGELDIFLAMPTEEKYTHAEIDVKNLNLTVSGLGETGISVTNLNFSLYYEVATKDEEVGAAAYLFGDFSDPSVRRNLKSIFATLAGQDIPDEQFNAIFATIFGTGKVYVGVQTLIDTFSGSEEVVIEPVGLIGEPVVDEPVEEEVADPDYLREYLLLARESYSSLLAYIPVIVSSIEKLPDMVVYKDAAGSISEVGLALNEDVTDSIASGISIIPGQTPSEEQPVESNIEKALVGAAILVGNKNGSTNASLESIKAKAIVNQKQGVQSFEEVNIGFKYNSSVSKTVGLTDSQIETFDTDFSNSIEMIKQLIGGFINQ